MEPPSASTAVGRSEAESPWARELRIPDLSGHVGQQRHFGMQQRRVLQLPVAGECTDRHLLALHADVAQLGEPADVHQDTRYRHPQLHQRQQ
jgi:hypothetical protein